MDFTHTKGDTWNGAIFEILENGTPLDLTGATFLCQIKKHATDSDSVLELSPQVTDGAAGKLEIAALVIDIPARQYVFDIQITLASGRILTPISGTFTILQDVSRR